MLKVVWLRKDGDLLSAIEPESYARRFHNFINKNVFN